jgi:formate dehydrogenase subunit gamma
MERVRKYSMPAVIFHWVHSIAFVLLVITGIFLFFPGASALAQDSWSRLVHRAASILFVVGPLIQVLANRRTTWESIKHAFTWGQADVEWALAMPSYYVLAEEDSMPPQEEMNTGQKLWYFMLLLGSPVFIVTGILMWFFKGVLPPEVFQLSLVLHDAVFIMTFLVFLVHIYLGVIHPLMRQHGGAFSCILDGTVTAEYAKSHHGKWYGRIKSAGQ